MIRAGIIGGSDPIAGELLSILINHPDVEIAWVNAPNSSGCLISDTHKGLIGETYLRFTDNIDFDNIDVLFLCTSDGRSKALLSTAIIPEKLKIVDLSGDFRIDGADSNFVYGLPELNRKALVRGALRASVPSAMANVLALTLLPLAKNLLLNSPITAVAVTSTTDPVIIDRPLGHKQVDELRATLESLQVSFNSPITFTPIRGTHSRGIHAVAYMQCPLELDDLIRIYEDFYSDHSFTFVTSSMPILSDVTNTNKCLLHLAKVGDILVVTGVIDNLVKGSAGQAVHNMNLLFGLHERVGLALKSINS